MGTLGGSLASARLRTENCIVERVKSAAHDQETVRSKPQSPDPDLHPVLQLQKSVGNQAVMQHLQAGQKLELSYPQPGGAFRYQIGGSPGEKPFDDLTDSDVDTAFGQNLTSEGLQQVPKAAMSRLDPAVWAEDPANRGKAFRSALEPPGQFAHGTPGAPAGPGAKYHGAMGTTGGTADKPVYQPAEQSEITAPRTTYAVRVGPGGSYADHVFDTQAEAEAYARSAAARSEAEIRETAAIRHAWNPVDAVRVYAIPPHTMVLRSGIAPQPEDHPNVPAGSFGGGGMQVQLPYGVIDKNTEPLAVYPVMNREPAPGTAASRTAAGSPAAVATSLRPTLVTELVGAQARYQDVNSRLAPLEAKRNSHTALTDDEKQTLDALTKRSHELDERLTALSGDLKLIDEPGTSDAALNNLLARRNAQVTVGRTSSGSKTGWRLNETGMASTTESTRTEVKEGAALAAETTDTKKLDLSTPGAIGYSSGTETKFSNVAGAAKVASTHSGQSKLTAENADLTYTHTTGNKLETEDRAKDYKTSSGALSTTTIGTGGVSKTTEITESAGSHAITRKDTAGVVRGEGQLGAVATTSKKTGEVDSEGNLVKGTETKLTASQGIVAGDEGTGGYATAGMASTKEHGQGVKTGQTVDVNGRFVVNVEQVKGKDPAEYLVTLRIDLGAKVGASLGKEHKGAGGTQGNVDASVSASGTVSHAFTQVMDAEATKRYLGELAANGAGGARKEMRVLQLAAAGSLYAAQRLLVAPGMASAQSAKDMPEGSVDELDLSGTAGGKLGGGAKGGSGGGSVEIGYSKSGTLRHIVSKKGGKVIVTVDVSAGDTLSLSGKGSYGLVGLGAGHEGTDTKGQSVTFSLDPSSPDYEKLYAQITSTDSVDELRRLAGQRKQVVSGHTESSGHAAANTFSATVGPAGVDIKTTHAYKESSTTDAQGRQTHSYSGSTGGGLGVSVAGAKYSYTTTDTVSGTATSDNKAAGDASTTTSETNVEATLTNLENAVKSPSKALGLITGGTKVVQEHTEVIGMSLSDADYATIAATAGTRDWDMAEISNRNGADWRALGRRIAAANGDRNTITSLLAQYGKDHDNAAHAVATVVRPAGTASGGTLYDWPDGLDDEKASYGMLVDSDSLAAIRELEGAAMGKDALDKANETMKKLDDLASSMQAKKDKFGDQAVLQQMLTRLTKRRADVAGEAVVIGHRLNPSAMAKRKVRQLAARASAADKIDDEEVTKERTKAAAKAMIDGSMDQLAAYRSQEDQQWAIIGRELGKKSSVWSKPDVYVMIPALTRLKKDIYPPWEALVNDVKKAAEEAGIDYWSLKLESNRLIPNRGWTRDLEKQATAGYGSGLPMD
jgi:hypothetical protein